jgi:hypothetical protein
MLPPGIRIALLPGSDPERFVIFDYPEKSKASGHITSNKHLLEWDLRATLETGGATNADIDATIAAARETAPPA